MVDITELETRMGEVQREIGKIQAQLSSRNRLYPDGSRMVGRDYWEWRQRAVHALTGFTAELQDLRRQRSALLRSPSGRESKSYRVLYLTMKKIGSGEFCTDSACLCVETARSVLVQVNGE